LGIADAMSIRPAKFIDIPEILGLMVGAHAVSKYRDRDQINKAAAKSLIQNSIQRHGLKAAGGSCVFVTHEVDGFLIGLLDNLYHVGTKLCAQQVFYYCRPGCHPQDAIGLIGEYVAWASGIPNVLEIRNDVTDFCGDVDKVEALYSRCGFKRCGVIVERKIK
jgi:hypothetical protein